jgi:hypothetical protein
LCLPPEKEAHLLDVQRIRGPAKRYNRFNFSATNMSGRRKRRAIEESSDNEDDNRAKKLDQNDSSAAVVTGSIPYTAAELVKTRLRERLQKSQAKAAEIKTKTPAGEEISKDSSKREDGASPQETVIPKKKKETPNSIPKKDSDNRTDKPSSSLLAMMKHAPPPPSSVAENSGNHRSKNTPANHSMSYARPNRPPYTSRGPPASSAKSVHQTTPPREVTLSTPTSRPPNQGGSGTGHGQTQGVPPLPQRTPTTTPVTSHPPLQPLKPQRDVKLEQMVWDTLHQLCQEKIKDLPVGDNDKQGTTPAFEVTPTSSSASSSTTKKRPPIDLTGSILKLKQTLHQHPIMLTDLEESLDFFDLDDEGCIVLQPVIPMFPEDFPADSQQREWPLSVST